MPGLDDRIAHLMGGGASLAVVLAVALALGLRHATDPDHLAAVSTLIATDPATGRRQALRLGLSWGMGHATTLLLFGLPIVLFRSYLPEPLQQLAELLVGVMIVALAVRLLIRWRAGAFHVHEHRHGPTRHRHLHAHRDDHGHSHAHAHEPERQLGRTSRQAYAIGIVHGIGGSAGLGVLLLTAIPDHAEATAALAVFAGTAALSMALLSSAFGYALARGPARGRVLALAPAMGVVSLVFGAWYALAAVGVVPYGA
jgi:ABC-type nickel/cobalt efflux system permease component RcnA